MAIKPLGQFLLEMGALTKKGLENALAEQEKTHERLGETLIRLGFITEKELVIALSKQCNVDSVDLTGHELKPDIVQLIPESLARRHKLIALDKTDNVLSVAVADPLNPFIADDIKRSTGYNAKIVVCAESAIDKALNSGYSKEEKKGMKEESLESVAAGDEVVKLVDSLIERAAKERASDIHIESEEKYIIVRFRIDGMLHDIEKLSKESGPAIISRIKVMAKMDIAEKRIPQDGRIVIDEKRIDLRVSTLPTIFGEKVAMRLLNRSVILIKLEQLGFQEETLSRFREAIKSPYGIILVTGPTSSGKTTTLYAAINMLNTRDKNIITIEEPVEFHIEGINQVQVNTQTGLTFAAGLRSILRQDPNIIMVGEVRDFETAQIAIQSALTGHLVFSTVHTNNAPATLTRLIDMKIEQFLISSSVIGILAQRLIRLTCPHCKEAYNPSEDIIKNLGLSLYGSVLRFFRGKGCDACKGTGYLGRTGIFEFMTMNEQIHELIISKACSTNAIRQAARKAGMQTLREDGLQKVLKGITTIEEVMRATIEEEG